MKKQFKKYFDFDFKIPDKIKPTGLFAVCSNLHESKCDRINCKCDIKNICDPNLDKCIK